MNLKKIFSGFILLSSVVAIQAQGFEDNDEWQKETSSMPKAIDFSKMFEEDEKTRQDFNDLKQKRETELRQKMMEAAALEKAIDPENYIVGPGDIFTFNIWGAMEMQIPLTVSPEGLIVIPSVGEIDIKNQSLIRVKEIVLDKAKPYYEKSEISLMLVALRSFRVHVVGEVEYPGTYIANPTERISDMITEAGGATDWANKLNVQLRRLNTDTLLFNLSAFESNGDVEGDVFVNGGDVIFVPSIDLSSEKVYLDGDFKTSGTYQILSDESIHNFLLRVNAFNKNTSPDEIVLIRKEDQIIRLLKPYKDNIFETERLKDGDRIVVPSAYVYVKGSVQNPGVYPYVTSYTAKDYAGMAGGAYQSASIQGVKVYQSLTGKTKRGPDAPVAPGDVVDLPQAWGERLKNWGPILSAIASSVLAAKAVGLIGE